MNMQMNNVMIDIETLGKKRGCPVLSIAAVQFDPQTGNTGDAFYERISYDAAISYGMPEISTIQWWDKQSEEARDAAFNGNRLPVDVAAELRAFLHNVGGGRCIPWGNGSVFDITILEGWFDRVNPLTDAYGEDIYPWKYRNIADLRTLVRVSGINVKDIPVTGDKHNALADALHQVKIAHKAWQYLFPGSRSHYQRCQIRTAPLLPDEAEYNLTLADCEQVLRTLGNWPIRPCPGEMSIYPFGQHTHGCRTFLCNLGHNHIGEYMFGPKTGNCSHEHE
ncbi:3'-5' exoribonuclease [Erwinia tracheiphila]|uniref:3'-5' exonuclease n=1 Tax=Erwinia tracheiphila TaxID=65700 RepID=UPI000336C867|nr:3'-5' exonuclease [Erwinia tracheiphila]EOS93103.1 Exodeoxyribonuclease VIII [Erwinia tracheiphila PSU-1]UIA89066.1 3'-5' exoribonuclease [Erwinia tracheiphila]UIA97449.1 3'-5' exoribonuclease [Erwinia tracheiphila]